MSLETLRHSTSHILAVAILDLFPKAKVGIGPSIEDGFYYDFDNLKISDKDLPRIEKKMKELVKKDLKFERKEVSKVEAKKIFKNQPYKLDLIKDLKKITIYKTGNFTDLCQGPHVKSTKEINPEAFKLTKIAGAYWKGDEKNKMLTRIYGVAFETEKELKDYLRQQEEAEKRDHRKLGKELDLFHLDDTAPGMPYWLPKGLKIMNELLEFWRKEHEKRGYQEISAPLVNDKKLWEISGHWDHYHEDMFIIPIDEEMTYAIKPMNCPNAMVVYKLKKRSYRDLPLRFSDADILHRNEKSGTLHGLLRVRMFRQDDSHNFITEDQIEEEYRNILDITELFYSVFGLKYHLRLGTRPPKFMGDVKTWNRAEDILKKVLNKKVGKGNYDILEGDGAFYGPKIDIIMEDAIKRSWQMGTIQLDFQIPKRFDLKYIDKDGKEKTPVVIHRVIYGSMERFIGILIEHFAGAFPVWLAPVQAQIIPISQKFNKYAKKVEEELKKEKIRTELNDSDETLGKKIRNGELQKIPYLLVVGEKEEKANSVAVRDRKKGDLGPVKVKQFIKQIKEEIEKKK
ncbi:MAG: threonine--tRNA ligase [Candidatus Portnoybacteria bacterium]